MKRCLPYVLLLMPAFFFAACEKEDRYSSMPHENFEALWKIMDEHYCFFEYKQVDWDELHERYGRQLSDTMRQFALFDLLGSMLAELKDGHTNLVSPFNVSRYLAWYEDYPPNFYKELQDRYLGKSADYLIAGSVKYKRLSGNSIGYMHYSSFSGSVSDPGLDYIFDYFKDCKGLIIDIRDNGGGSLANADLIASRFIEEKLLTGYIQHKLGKGHNDFSEPYPVYLAPSARVRWLRPVAVLTNRHCFSAANDFAQKMRMMPQVTVIGDRTGGGSGLPLSSELPNGWSIRFSAAPMLDADKQHTEFGIDPDIRVNITPQDLSDGKDPIIEAAILHILSQQVY